MDFKDYYKILGVEPSADEKTIKAAYRKLARKYHPDVSKEPNAEAHFKEANEAYDALSSPEKRAEYDELRKYGVHGRPFQAPPGYGGGGNFGGDTADFSEFFSSIFGNQSRAGNPFGSARGQSRSSSRRGKDVELELALFLEETLAGESKQVSFRVPQYNAAGHPAGSVTKTLNVKIPGGVTDGERVRLKGQGGPGHAGGEAGDLYITIRYAPHPRFTPEGTDLVVEVPVAPWELALGAKVPVPTLTGRINLTIRPDSQNGQRLRVKDNGLPIKGGGRGDLFVQLKAVMPPRNEATRELWEKLASKAGFDPRG